MIVVKGLLFLLIYLNALRQVGKWITKKDHFFQNLIYGYVAYYAMQFVLGFIFQLSLGNVIYYHWIVGILLTIINGYSIYEHIKEPVSFDLIKKHFQTYWLVYLFSFVLIALSVIYAPGHYLSNNLDDGYYMMKVINFTKGININIDPATGFLDVSDFKTKIARIVNTHELDLASYCYLFHMDVLVFVRYFYAWFQYFLTLVSIVVFFESIFSKQKARVLTYGLIGILFFALYPRYFELLKIVIQDDWQFNTAMWYGSSICRIPALFILFYFLFEYQGQILKQLLFLALMGCTLMSKGTQILPILVYTGYIWIWMILWDQKVPKIVKVLPLPLFALLSVLLNHFVSYSDEVGANIVTILKADLKNPIMLMIMIAFILLMIKNKDNVKLLRWNLILCFFMIFSFIDPINDILTTFSIYYFVAARATTLIFFSILMTVSYEIADLVINFKLGNQMLLISTIGGMVVVSAVGYLYIGLNCYEWIINNPKLTYNTVLSLSEYLNELDIENGEEEVRVVVSNMEGEGEKQYIVTPNVNVRYYANDITVVSLEIRYSCHDQSNVVSYYTLDANHDFEELNKGDLSVFDSCKHIWDLTKTNTVVLRNNDAKALMEQNGFNCTKEIIDYDGNVDYYVYYRN